jgi:hypothetical protein
LDVFLKPTCGKCARFLKRELKPLWDKLESARLRDVQIRIRVRPFQSTSSWIKKIMPNSPQAQVDRELALLWMRQLTKGQSFTLEQLLRWYSIVEDHKLDPRYVTDPVKVFSEVFACDVSLSEEERAAQESIIHSDVNQLPEDIRRAPSVVVNKRAWRALKQYHISAHNVIDLIHSWDDFSKGEAQDE